MVDDVDMKQPLTGGAVHDEGPRDQWHKDSLSELFGVQEIYPHADNKSQQSQSLTKFIREYNALGGLVKGLNTDTQKGIETNQVADRQLKYGDNKPRPKIPASTWEIIKGCLEDTILQILLGATVVSLITGYIQDGPIGLVDGFSILIAVVVIIAVTVGNDKVKQKQFQELEAKSSTAESIVTRNGKTETIDADTLVVGDVVHLELGKAIPADCIVF